MDYSRDARGRDRRKGYNRRVNALRDLRVRVKQCGSGKRWFNGSVASRRPLVGISRQLGFEDLRGGGAVVCVVSGELPWTKVVGHVLQAGRGSDRWTRRTGGQHVHVTNM